MTVEDDPYQAGIGFTVKLGKGEFVGRDALAARKAAGRTRGSPGSPSTIRRTSSSARNRSSRGETVVGYVRSAAYGYSVGHDLTSVMLPVELTAPGTPLTIEWFGRRLPATVVKDPVWDPAGERIRA